MTRVSTRTAQPRVRRRKTPRARLGRAGILFVLPAAAYIAAFHVYPVLYGLFLSFTDYSPLRRGGPEWVGVGNYAELLSDPAFGRSLLVTVEYVVRVLPFAVVLALLLALLVNKPFRGVGLFRSAIYTPHIVSLIVVSMIWLWIYSDQGLVNQILGTFGIGGERWLLNEDTAMEAVAIMRVWKMLGGNMVLLLAGLQSIPKELYEAARVDGAGWWAQLRYVTIPGLRPMLIYVVAVNVIGLSQGFAEIFLLTQGGPLGSTTITNYLIYTEAFQYNRMGSASAMAFILFALISAMSLLAVRAVAGRRQS